MTEQYLSILKHSVGSSIKALQRSCTKIYFSPIKRVKEYGVNENDEVLWEENYEDIDYDLLLHSDEDDNDEMTNKWELVPISSDKKSYKIVQRIVEPVKSNQSVESYAPENIIDISYEMLLNTDEDKRDEQLELPELEVHNQTIVSDKFDDKSEKTDKPSINKCKLKRSVKSNQSVERYAPAPVENILNINYDMLLNTDEDERDQQLKPPELEVHNQTIVSDKFDDKLEKTDKPSKNNCKRKKPVKSPRRKKKSAGPDAPKEYIVEKVLGRRTHCREVQYLIQWKGFDDKTWEPEKNLHPTLIQSINKLVFSDSI